MRNKVKRAKALLEAGIREGKVTDDEIKEAQAIINSTEWILNTKCYPLAFMEDAIAEFMRTYKN